MRRKLFVIIMLISLFAVSSGVENLPIFTEWVPDSLVTRPPVYHWTLDNGLEVLFWENHTVPLVASKILLKTGSAFEGEYLGCGISHYLEHLVSSGTTSKRTESEYKMLIQQIGATTNAYTTSDVTVYYNTGPVKYFDTMLAMLAEWTQDCQFNSEEVERETGVITNEIKMGQEEPGRVLWYLYNNLMYKVSPYRHPTIGYLKSFLSVERDDIIDYYNDRYAPNNAILAIAGDLDTATVIATVESLFGDWERRRIVDVQLPDEPLPVAARVAEKEMDTEVANFRIGFPTTFFGEQDMPALRILGMILSGVQTSRFDLRLVQNENPLCHSITAYSRERYYGRGEFIIGGSFDYENRDKIVEALWDEIDKVKNQGVSEEEVEWAKDYIIKSLKRENETVDGQASSIMYSFLNTGVPFYLDFYILAIQRVTSEDVRRVAKKYLVPEHMVMAIVKPIGATCPGDSVLVKDISTKPPEFEVFTLPNGLRLALAENPALATVDIAMYILGGAIYEPSEKAGLAKFTANYLGEGTKKYKNFEKFQRILDELNIQVSINAGNHTVYLTGDFVSTDLDEVLDIMEQIIFYPIFPEESEQKLKNQMLAEIRQARSSWASDAFMFFEDKFYRHHPYSKPTSGYEETVTKLTPKDAKQYWESILNPKNIVVAASGPIPVKTMKEKLEKVLGKISGSNKQLPEIPEPPKHNEPEYYSKEVNREQVTLIIGYDACNTNNEEDKWALKTASGLLSGTGGLSGWLPVELRGKRNLVYVVWGTYRGMMFGGNFYVMTQCQPADLDTVKTIILEQIEKLKSGDFTQEDVERITNAAAEQFVFSKQRQANIVTDAGLNELYGFGVDYSDKYPEKIRSVTKDDVVRVANKYLNNPVIVELKPAVSEEIEE